MISGLSERSEKQIGDAVLLSPIIRKVLVMRETIEKSEALAKLDEIARKRDWLGRPIYRYVMKYFDNGILKNSFFVALSCQLPRLYRLQCIFRGPFEFSTNLI